jgi:HD-like signal output (HDOD) protein
MKAKMISKLLSRIDSFPTLPMVVNRVLDLTADPESTPRDLMRVIETDQALMATTLKVANSAFFGRPRRIRSLEHALTLLGFSEIRNVVLMKAVFSSFPQLDGDSPMDLRQFWNHAFSCGIAARMLAERVRLSASDCFVAGLIHDIGKLVMVMSMPVEYGRYLQDTGSRSINSRDLEEKSFGLGHDDAGMKLLERWMFPEDLVNAVGYHHTPPALEDHQSFSPLIHVADIICHLDENAWADDELETARGKILTQDMIRFFGKRGLEWTESVLDEVLDAYALLKADEMENLQAMLGG